MRTQIAGDKHVLIVMRAGLHLLLLHLEVQVGQCQLWPD